MSASLAFRLGLGSHRESSRHTYASVNVGALLRLVGCADVLSTCPEPPRLLSGPTPTPSAASELRAVPRTARARPVRHPRSVDIVADDDRLLDVHEAAAFLGVKPRTLYKWVAQGQLSAVHLGRAVRFRMGALRARVREAEEPSATPLVDTAPTRASLGTKRAAPTRR